MANPAGGAREIISPREMALMADSIERFHLDAEKNATVPIKIDPYAQIILTNGHILKNETANNYTASLYKDSKHQWHLKIKGEVNTTINNIHDRIMSAAIQTLRIIPSALPSEEDIALFIKESSGMTIEEMAQLGITREMVMEKMQEMTNLSFNVSF